MGHPPRIHFPGAIFHVIARGNAQQQIFFTPEDWQHLLDDLSELKAARPFRLYAYCLMSNHIHLLIEPIDFPLSTIMAVLLTGYAKYLNARLERIGHVFQGRFKAPLCQRDAYFQHLVRYIHLNPVRAKMVAEPAAWPYSGHLEYLGRSARSLIDTGLLFSTLHEDPASARAAYERFVLAGMSGPAPLREVPAPSVAPPIDRPHQVLEVQRDRPPLDRLAAACSAKEGLPPAALQGDVKVRAVCRARREFMRKAFVAGYSPTEIAAHVALTTSAVSKALKVPLS